MFNEVVEATFTSSKCLLLFGSGVILQLCLPSTVGLVILLTLLYQMGALEGPSDHISLRQ
jgi:hypothetical protein